MAIDYGRPTTLPGPAKSAASIIAIIAAIGSFYLSFKGMGFRGLLVAGIGVIFGLVGFLRAASPRVSGGILSLTAVALSAIGAVVALIAIVL
jgi:hypothetical protein